MELSSNTNSTPFRVGAVYRDKNGALYELAPLTEGDQFYRDTHPGEAIASSFPVDAITGVRTKSESSGAHSLSDGRFLAIDSPDCWWNLQPEEVRVPMASAPQQPAPAVPTAIPFERPLSPREAEWKLRQAMARDVAEAAAREAEARRCAPLPACEGLLRLAPMR